MSTIARVIRSEGFASAARRGYGRISEAALRAARLTRGAFARSAQAPVVNIAAAGVSPRLGGVAAQLEARMNVERSLRSVALLDPGLLDLSSPVRHARRLTEFHPTDAFASPDFEKAVRESLAMTGARAIHLEGMSGVPAESVLRLRDSGVEVIISLHDFSLFCRRAHLLEQPVDQFCSYSFDLDRCDRCLEQSGTHPENEQAERRRLGREILTAATGLIFPSQFLLDRHRDLFSLLQLEGRIVEPATATAPVTRTGEKKDIAFGGSLKRHKGADLLPEIIQLTGPDVEWHIFGGGDEELLRPLRRFSNVTVHGYYRSGSLPSLLSRHRVGLMIFPSIVPETFALSISEAWLSGAAVGAFDLGAPAERIRRHGGGWLAPEGSGAAGLAEIIDRWRSGEITTQIPAALNSPSDAAHAHLKLYRSWGLLAS